MNHRTPLSERWEGWYVTGAHGTQQHRGNLIGQAAFTKEEREPNYLGNLTELKRFFDVSRYPGKESDIVALMIFEHQTHMHNFITRLHYETSIALQTYGHVNYLKSICEAFLKYLLFTEETLLTAPIKGASVSRGTLPARDLVTAEVDRFATPICKHDCSSIRAAT